MSVIKMWVAENLLQLNQDRTEVFVIGSEAESDKVQFPLSTKCMSVCDTVRNLGVSLDADLSFDQRLNQISKTALYRQRKIAWVRHFLSKASAEILVHPV